MNVAKTASPTPSVVGLKPEYPNIEKNFPVETIRQPPPATSYKSFADKASLGNTATQNVIRQTEMDQVRRAAQKKLRDMYQQLLSAGTAGADAAYKSAVETYKDDTDADGRGVQDYIPPKELFIDPESGQFLPHQYYQSVYTGVQKFREESEKAKQLAGEKRQREMIAGAPADALQSEIYPAIYTVSPETATAKDVQDAIKSFDTMANIRNRASALKKAHASAVGQKTKDNLPLIQSNTLKNKEFQVKVGNFYKLVTSALESVSSGKAISDMIKEKLKGNGIDEENMTVEGLTAIANQSKKDIRDAEARVRESEAAEEFAKENLNTPYTTAFNEAGNIAQAKQSKQVSDLKERIQNEGLNISDPEVVSALVSKSSTYPWLNAYDVSVIEGAITSMGGEVNPTVQPPPPPPPEARRKGWLEKGMDLGRSIMPKNNVPTSTIGATQPTPPDTPPKAAAPINPARERAISNLKAQGIPQEKIDAFIAKKFGQ